MKNIKVNSEDWLFYDILVMYSRLCFEVYTDNTGGNCFLFKDSIICLKEISSDLFNIPIKTVYKIKGTVDLDLLNNNLKFTNIKSYICLTGIELIDLADEIQNYTRIDFHGDPLK